ncbi:MAG: universal stress protein [Rubrivivax sp.]|nr:universal stress protein [Rubrivivax sp.]
MTRPLLLATEGTEHDQGAQRVALALAARTGEPLLAILPLTSNAEYEAIAPQLAARAEAEARVKADALQAAAQAAGVALQLSVRRGPEAYEEIVDEARRTHCRLLLIRRRGRRGLLANLLVGEMVSKVVAHAPCDVLIAPREARLWRQGLLVAVDPLNPLPSLLALAAARARDAGLPLHVVSVALDATRRPLAEAAVAAAVHEARAMGADARGQARTGRPHEQLPQALADLQADLLVIARHGRQQLARAWIGGVAQKLIGLVDLPVLVHVPELRRSDETLPDNPSSSTGAP